MGFCRIILGEQEFQGLVECCCDCYEEVGTMYFQFVLLYHDRARQLLRS